MGRKSRLKRARRDRVTRLRYSRIFRRPKARRAWFSLLEEVEAGKYPEVRSKQQLTAHVVKKMIQRQMTEKGKDFRTVMIATVIDLTMNDVFCDPESYHNYYVTSIELLDFLKHNKVRKDDMPKVAEIFKEVCDKSMDRFAFHLPNERWSIVVYAGQPDFKDKNFRSTNTGEQFIAYLRGNRKGCEDFGWVKVELEGHWITMKSRAESAENWRILFNVFLYMDAFPDSIRPGPPPIDIPAGTRAHSSTLEISEPLRHAYDGQTVSPHMRRGHFRFLRSKRYTKKRWQTIYVRPTMVKGTAEHIVKVEAEA